MEVNLLLHTLLTLGYSYILLTRFISFLAYSMSAKVISFFNCFSSSFVSSNLRCVYTFMVVAMSAYMWTCQVWDKKNISFSCRKVPDHSNQVPQHFYYLPQNRSCPEHFISALKIHHQNSIQFRFPPGYAPG